MTRQAVWRAVRQATALVAQISLAACAAPPVSIHADAPLPALATTAGLDDGRGRFREIYTAVRTDHGDALPDDRPVPEALHQLRDEPDPTGRPVPLGTARRPMQIMFVTGLFGEYFMDALAPFPYARDHLEVHGYRTELIAVNGRSSCAHNAAQIRDAVIDAGVTPDDTLVLVGYSKGAVDALTAVTEHPELRRRVDAVVSVCGPIGGSPVADDMPGLVRGLIEVLPVPMYPAGDGGAIDSLRPATRATWLAEHELPASVRFYSVAAFAERGRISSIHRATYDRLAKIDPRNDGQVILSDAVIPGSTLLGMANTDHYGAALAISRDQPLLAGTVAEWTAYPREIFLEAIVRFVEEDLGDDSLR